MKKLFLLVFLSVFGMLFAQSKIVVMQSGERKPIANAKVSCNQVVLGYTNSEGILIFKTNCKKLDVSAKGFIKDEVVVDKQMEITLATEEPGVTTIDEVVLKDKSDPLALKILDKVNENYNQNSPKSLDSYAFKSYDKISYD